MRRAPSNAFWVSSDGRGPVRAPLLRFACAPKLRFVAWLSPSAFAAVRGLAHDLRAVWVGLPALAVPILAG